MKTLCLNVLAVIVLYLFNSVDAGWNNWHSWSSCSVTCGGGTRKRERWSAVWSMHDSQDDTCNKFCYNGGWYGSNSCHCPAGVFGVCCEEFPHCSHSHLSHRSYPSHTTICNTCYDSYYSRGWGKGCSLCKSIEHCLSRYCTTANNQKCRKCANENIFFKKTNHDQLCSRMCAWNGHYCWPGKCSNDLAANCDCVEEFEATKTSSETSCQPKKVPSFETCRMTAYGTGGVKDISPTNGTDTSCKNQQDFYGKYNVTAVYFDMLANYIINTTAFGSRPKYVAEERFGVTDVLVRLVKETMSGSSLTVLTKHLLVDNTSSMSPNQTFSKKAKLTIKQDDQKLENGQSLCMVLEAKGGGYLNAIDLSSAHHTKNVVPYKKAVGTKKICYRFDNSAPRHCMENGSCKDEPIQLAERITRSHLVEVNFTGWFDVIPDGGSAVHASGIDFFEITVNEVSAQNGILKVNPGKKFNAKVSSNTTSMDLSLVSTSPRLYCINLEVVDVAKNPMSARRFILIDNTSYIETRDGHPFIVSSASQETSYMWQTHHNDICLSWPNHFMNKEYNNTFLSPIEKGSFAGVYEQITGDLPVTGTSNIYGIIDFKFSWQTKDGMVSSEISVPDFQKQRFCKRFKVNDGEIYILRIRAVDIVGNTLSENRTTHIDRTSPYITNMGLLKNGNKQLYVHNGKDLSTMQLYFEAMDPHSGIRNVEWAFSVQDTGQEIIQKSLGVANIENSSMCPDGATTCYCPSVGPCQMFNYSVVLNALKALDKAGGDHNRNYVFSINVTNHALLSTIEHFDVLVDDSPPEPGVVFEGPVDGPDIDFTSGDSFNAHWHGFIDHESGIKLYRVGLAERCLSKNELYNELYNLEETKMMSNDSDLILKETFESQIKLSANFTGLKYVTVVALNNAMDPSISVCSDGITVDTTPPTITNVTLEKGSWEETIACFKGRAWLFEAGLSKIMLHNTSTCYSICSSSSDEIKSLLLPTIEMQHKDTEISDFMCDRLEIYDEDTATIFLPTDRLVLKWDLQEDLSQIHDFSVGFGRDKTELKDPKLVHFMSTNRKAYFKYNHVGIGSKEIFYIFIKAENKAGLESVSTIGPVLIDQTPPLVKVKPSIVINDQDVVFGWDNDTFYDTEQTSTINQITFQFGQEQTKISPLLEWTRWYSKPCSNYSGGCVQYPLKKLQRHDTENGKLFHIDVYVYNNAGHANHFQTEEFRVPSKYPPGHAVIYDTDSDNDDLQEDLDFHLKQNLICARWEGFHHHEDIRLEFGVGTAKDRQDVLPFRKLLPKTSHHCETNTLFQENKSYYVTIRASCSGGQSTSVSDGVRILDPISLLRKLDVLNGYPCSVESSVAEVNLDKYFSDNTTISFDFTKAIIGRQYSIEIEGDNLSNIAVFNESDILIDEHISKQRGASLIISGWPTTQKIISGTVMANGHGKIKTVSTKACNSLSNRYQSSTAELPLYWTLPTEFQHHIKYEVAILHETCEDVLNGNCMTLVMPYQTPSGNLTHVFRQLSLKHNTTYRTAVRPCINAQCLNHSLSNPITIDALPPTVKKISASITQFNGTFVEITARWDSFESLSKIVFYQWTVIDGVSTETQLTAWRTIAKASDTIMVTQSVQLPVLLHRATLFCVRGFSETGSVAKVCTELQKQEALSKSGDANTVYDIESSTINWRKIRKLLHSENVGSLLTLVHDSDLNFGNETTNVAGFVLHGTERTIDWFLMKKRVVPDYCESDSNCIVSRQTETGFVQFSKSDLKLNVPLFICASSRKQNISREMSTEILREFKTCSNGFVLDDTLPKAGTVLVSDNNGYLTDANNIAFSWEGFSDMTDPSALGYDSPILKYNYFIGSQPGKADVQISTPVIGSSAAVAHNLDLKDGTLIYVSIKAEDYAGHSVVSVSKPSIVDTSPPLTGRIDIYTGTNKRDLEATSTLIIYFGGFLDAESGLKHFLVGIGSSLYQTDVMSPVICHTDSYVVDLQHKAIDGHRYFISVQAVNRAGLSSKVITREFLYDATAPVGGFVLDGHAQQDDVDFQVETHSIGGRWYGFEDPHTGVTYYRAGLGSRPLLDDVKPMADVGLTNEIFWNTSFNLGKRYYLTMEACNRADLCRRISSDGLLIDTSPPIAGLVRIGSQRHSRHYQPRRTSLHIEWMGFEDPQSGIEHFKACVGTKPYSCNIIPEFNCLLQSSIVKSNLNLPTNTDLYATVTAVNKANMTTTQSSEWFRVDETEPVLISNPKFYTDFNMISGTTAQWERSILRMTWKFQDDECPIIKHIITLLTHHEGHTPVEHTEIGAEDKLTINLKPHEALRNGDSYRFVVTACNVAGLCNSAESKELLIDSTPPHLGGFKPPMTWNSWTDSTGKIISNVTLTWYGFSDPESNIKMYYLTISRTYSKNELSGGVISVKPSRTQMEVNSTFSLTDEIKHDEKVILSVWAENNAGLFSSVSRVTVIALSTSTRAGHFNKGLLQLEKHSCDVHFCNKDCTCAVVGKPCTDVDTNSSCVDLENTTTTENIPDIKVHGGMKSSPSNVTGSSTCLAGHWTVNELFNNSIHRYEWSMGKENGPPGYGIFDLQKEIPWNDVGLRQEIIHCLPADRRVGLMHEKNYIVYVRAWFGPNTYKIYESEKIMVDQTPPHIKKGGFIKDSDDDCQTDRDFVTFVDNLTACWTDVFTELQTRILYYMVGLGSQPGASDILQWENVQLATNYTVRNVSKLTPGSRFYFTVTAFNTIGLQSTLSSDGFVVDNESPIQGVVFNTDKHQDKKHQSSLDSFSISWHGFTDHHSSIKTYYVGLSECETKERIINFANVGIQNRHTFQNINLVHNKSYCGIVKAEDAAGHVALPVFSDPVVIDSTPPTTFSCNEFESLNSTVSTSESEFGEKFLLLNHLYLINGTIVSSTGKTLIRLSIGRYQFTLPTAMNDVGSVVFQYKFLSPLEGLANISTVVLSSLTDSANAVLSNHLYHCTHIVKGVNSIIEPQQLGPNQISVNFPVMDEDSGINQVLVGAGTSPGSFQIHPLTPVKGGINSVISLDAPHGSHVYVAAVAENNAGLQTKLHSLSLVLDLTPPTVTTLEATVTVEQESSDNVTDQLMISSSWLTDDEESDVKYCFMGAGHSPDSTDVIPFFKTQNKTWCQRNIPMVPHGSMIYVTVRCINKVEMATEATSDPVLVSYEKPSTAAAKVTFIPVNTLTTEFSSADIQSNKSRLQLSWQGFTDDSGIQEYEYQLTKGNTTVVDWTSAVRHDFALLDCLRLQDGSSYRAAVRAINRGQLHSEAVYADIVVDSRKPMLSHRPLQVTVHGSQLTLDWRDVFTLDSQIGYQYSVSVGSSPGYNDVMDLQSVKETSHQTKLSSFSNVKGKMNELFITVTCIYNTGASTTYRANYKMN